MTSIFGNGSVERSIFRNRAGATKEVSGTTENFYCRRQKIRRKKAKEEGVPIQFCLERMRKLGPYLMLHSGG